MKKSRANRRNILKFGISLSAGFALPNLATYANSTNYDTPARENSMRLVMLGTAGGPTPKRNRAAPSQVIMIDGEAFVVDCGNGVAQQYVKAGLKLAQLRHIFITHHHSDHNADYGNLMLLAWAADLNHRIDTYGPPPLKRITQLFLEMNAFDIQTRVLDEGRRNLSKYIHPHEIKTDGIVFDNGRTKVTAARVVHPPNYRSVRVSLRSSTKIDRDFG